MTGHLAWNHWFWVTLIAASHGSCDSLLIQSEELPGQEQPIFIMPEINKGNTVDGRNMFIVNKEGKDVLVSKSVSVSRVSVKIGGVRAAKNVDDMNSKSKKMQTYKEIIGRTNEASNQVAYDDAFKSRFSPLKTTASVKMPNYDNFIDDPFKGSEEYQLIYKDENSKHQYDKDYEYYYSETHGDNYNNEDGDYTYDYSASDYLHGFNFKHVGVNPPVGKGQRENKNGFYDDDVLNDNLISNDFETGGGKSKPISMNIDTKSAELPKSLSVESPVRSERAKGRSLVFNDELEKLKSAQTQKKVILVKSTYENELKELGLDNSLIQEDLERSNKAKDRSIVINTKLKEKKKIEEIEKHVKKIRPIYELEDTMFDTVEVIVQEKFPSGSFIEISLVAGAMILVCSGAIISLMCRKRICGSNKSEEKNQEKVEGFNTDRQVALDITFRSEHEINNLEKHEDLCSLDNDCFLASLESLETMESVGKYESSDGESFSCPG